MNCALKCLLISLSIAAAVAGDKDHPKFNAAPAESYPTHQTQDKVTQAAVPYINAELAEPAFGKANPYAHGILPILLVIKNETGRALRLDLEVSYVNADGSHVEPTPARDVAYLRGAARPANPGVSLPIPKFKKKNPLDTWEIEGRAFAAKMLPPGESVHGFFYFQVNYRPGSKLYVNGISEAGSGKELFYSEIPLEK